jgi:hypothetical protein
MELECNVACYATEDAQFGLVIRFITIFTTRNYT